MKSLKEIILSVIITIIVLISYMYLFVYADRKIVFLYEHLGYTPFDKTTTGRYWMSSLVLSGFLSIFYLFVQIIIKFVFKLKNADWKIIIKFSSIPLITGILFITMTLGEPRMPFLIAISIAFALLFGLSVGFSIADDLVKDFKPAIIYLLTGLGLVPILTLFRALELPNMGILPLQTCVYIVTISTISGFIWLIFAFLKFKKHRPELKNIIKGTLAIAYLGLPVLHYLLATPKDIPYITTSSNFIADNMLLRIINWVLMVVIALIADKLIENPVLKSQ